MTVSSSTTINQGTGATGTPGAPGIGSRGIDPRGPRFVASLTLVVLAVALLAAPSTLTLVLVGVQAVVFAIGAVLGIQRTPYSWVFRTLVRPRLGAPRELVEKEVLSLDPVARMLDGKPPRKLVIVPDRIVNVVI